MTQMIDGQFNHLPANEWTLQASTTTEEIWLRADLGTVRPVVSVYIVNYMDDINELPGA